MQECRNVSPWLASPVLCEGHDAGPIMRVLIAEPDAMRAFWQGWLKWSREAGIDYFIGRKIPAWLDSLGLEEVAGEGHTAQFNGGSRWATYWTATIRELAPALLKSGYITGKMLEELHSC
jgi:hypothetical protein